VFPPLVLHLLPLAIVVRVQKLASNHFISRGKWRVVTPGSAITRPTENICANSTCPKTPQSGFLEETEAVPAESIHPERSRTAGNASYRIEHRSYVALYINYEIKINKAYKKSIWNNKSVSAVQRGWFDVGTRLHRSIEKNYTPDPGGGSSLISWIMKRAPVMSALSD